MFNGPEITEVKGKTIEKAKYDRELYPGIIRVIFTDGSFLEIAIIGYGDTELTHVYMEV